MKIQPIKYHVRYKSAELMSISDRHYFSYNGITYSVTKARLGKLLKELEDYTNPLSATNYLLSQRSSTGFTKITK